MYTVKQFAEMFHTTAYTIRYYTDIDLLPCQRDKGNRRLFDEDAIGWMRIITCLKACGTSIEDIKKYCALCKLPETETNFLARYEIILQQRKQAYVQLEEAKTTVAYLDHKVQHYEEILAGFREDDCGSSIIHSQKLASNN